jgi:hypothetical protein
VASGTVENDWDSEDPRAPARIEGAAPASGSATHCIELPDSRYFARATLAGESAQFQSSGVVTDGAVVRYTATGVRVNA